MATIISPKVRKKINEKHNLKIHEVHEAIAGRLAGLLKDTRERHKSDPPTFWFIGSTDYGKLLKIALILKDGDLIIRTAYEANPDELALYKASA